MPFSAGKGGIVFYRTAWWREKGACSPDSLALGDGRPSTGPSTSLLTCELHCPLKSQASHTPGPWAHPLGIYHTLLIHKHGVLVMYRQSICILAHLKILGSLSTMWEIAGNHMSVNTSGPRVPSPHCVKRDLVLGKL